jgi:hypothetical protein
VIAAGGHRGAHAAATVGGTVVIDLFEGRSRSGTGPATDGADADTPDTDTLGFDARLVDANVAIGPDSTITVGLGPGVDATIALVALAVM